MQSAELDHADSVWSDPEAHFLSPSVRAMWRQQSPARRPDLKRFDLRERGKQPVVQRLTRALQQAEVTLLLGTDASAPGMFPGKSAHLELSELVRAGLTPYRALASATHNPGKFMHARAHRGSPFGTVSVGSRADLLLLEANPLKDISSIGRIAGVIVRGKWYPRAQIDSMRTQQSSRAPGTP